MSNFEQTMKLQQIAAAKKGIVNEIIQKKMQDEKFPNDKIDCVWISMMRISMRRCTPLTQRTNLKDFKDAVNAINADRPQLTLTQFQVIANSLDAVSIEQLEISEEAYSDLVDKTFSLIDIWEKKIKKINDDATLEAEAEYTAKSNVLNGKFGVKKGDA